MTADAGKRTAAADRAPAGDAEPGKGATKTRAARQKPKREPAAKKPPLSPDLAVVQTQVFRGPNYWSYEPCIRMLVDLGSLEYWPSNTIPGFNKKLLKALPGVGEHSCSLGKKGGFKERLEDGTWMGHVAEHVALELQREIRCPHLPGQDPERRPTGAVQRDLRLRRGDRRSGGRRARRASVEPPDQGRGRASTSRPSVEGLILLAERRQFGPSTQAIIDEAVTRDIPWIRLNEHSLVQLGQGTYQQRIRATMTSKTSALAVDVAGDKKMTNRLLASAGLPVPRSEVVRTEDDAVAGRQADRVPGGDQAAGRQPRSRGGAGPAHRPGRAQRVQAGGLRSAPRSGGGGVATSPATTIACW